jgi:RNA recognition motif-containing protein
MSRATLYVGGLQPDTRAARIGQEFERFGALIRCDIPTINGLSKGFGFVEFTHSRDAEAAFRSMQGKDIEGKHISIEWAKEPEYMRGSRGPRLPAIEPPRPSMRDDPRMARHDDRHDRHHDIPRHVDLPRHDMSRHDPYSMPIDRRDDRDRMRMPRHDDRIDDRVYPVPRAMEPRYPLDYARGPPPIMPPRVMDSRPPLRDLQRELPRDRMDPRDLRDNRPRVSRDLLPREPLPQSRTYPSNAPPISRPIDRMDRPRSSDLSRSDGGRSSRRSPERNVESRRRPESQPQHNSSSRQVEDNKRKSSSTLSRSDSSRNSGRSLSQAKEDESRKRAKAEDNDPVRQSSQDEQSEVEEIEVGQQHASQEEGDGEYQDDARDDEDNRRDEESQD